MVKTVVYLETWVNQNVLNFRKLWAIALFIKIAIATWLPLSNDEAYYWVWGQHPQLSYFDHPPMVGWLFSLGSFTDFWGSSVRIPGVIVGHLTLLIWYKILKPYLSEKELTFWLGFILLTPFFGLGSVIITPDIPLMFFWTLAIYFLIKLLDKKSLSTYALFGATLGLGFCSKYHMVLFVPFAWIWLISSGKWREINYKYLPVAVVVGILFCAPVLIWNMRNDWASFAFQLSHGLKGKAWRPTYPLEYLLGQVGLLFPFVIYLAMRRREPKQLQLLHAFAWLPLLFFLVTSFKARVEGNWPIIAHSSVFTLAFLNRGSKLIKTSMIIWGTLAVLIFSQIAFEWLPLNPKQTKAIEFTEFNKADEATRHLSPLYTGGYQPAAVLSFKQRRDIHKIAGMNRKDFYDFLPDSTPHEQMFYVVTDFWQEYPAWFEARGCQKEELQVLSDTLRLYRVTCHA
jgi:4-amino-4-deoxy-L-arabinose transferase-like glycosyltransferase